LTPYEDVRKVYGPYLRKDMREHVVIVFNDGSKKTVSYPKYIIENQLGRFLMSSEMVHHKDHDFTNNSSSNLSVVRRSEHSGHHAKRLKSQKFVCSVCNVSFSLEGINLSYAYQNRRKGRSGPYCSRRCAGKASHMHKEDREATQVRRRYTFKLSLTQETV